MTVGEKDVLRTRFLVAAYQSLGALGYGDLAGIAKEQAKAMGATDQDGEEALLYCNERGFLRRLTMEGHGMLDPRAVDLVERFLREWPSESAPKERIGF